MDILLGLHIYGWVCALAQDYIYTPSCTLTDTQKALHPTYIEIFPWCVSDAQAYADNVGAVLVETSAKTASNISALFYEICECYKMLLSY